MKKRERERVKERERERESEREREIEREIGREREIKLLDITQKALHYKLNISIVEILTKFKNLLYFSYISGLHQTVYSLRQIINET